MTDIVERLQNRKPRTDGTIYVCKCECGGNVRGIFDFDRLFSACDKCTPVVTIQVPPYSIFQRRKMTDIVERLRDSDTYPMHYPQYSALRNEAADEIVKLRERYDFQVQANRSLVEACAKSESENQWRRAVANAYEAISQTNQELCDEIERLHALLEKSPPAATG